MEHMGAHLNMEYLGTLLNPLEKVIQSWASPEIKSEVLTVEKGLIFWANPELPNKTPVSSFPMTDLLSSLTITACYLGFVFVASIIVSTIFGTKEQASGKGSVLQKFMAEPLLIFQALYNLSQVLLCAYMASSAFLEAGEQGYSFICNGFNANNSGMAKVLWVFYMSKIWDFWDTVFIITRRKWRQLSFLHVYHHSSIYIIYWLNLRAGYDGDIYYTIIANSLIHLIMYGYYFLRTFNVPVPMFIKALVTNMQMIQFVTMIGQAVCLMGFGCPYPTKLVQLYFLYIISMLVLFNNFAAKTYKKPEAKAKTN
mmetsp:Transcript_27718/g.33884  ORF Transcript_27718/g.33884 Transcript_27718/m.33884 type:complete len:311 (+) Transcript_27718:150-1082(+)|eukprot:CAMPEP_0204875762 /NCGR_PEP_ID=MMETSP1348-20121228/46812_1 /ASSEMBLY_ACC=CAM_ASM_000700 /TAXON_ID=215587 /ORGANISM="Aplanochytrium stocchinoi, Strain GSBS06" /LENGTH=310 /DNA_ID=CAMNT_0052032365 /DNA_START=54 /DNA_END=986 /DNA_ORIENTATION=+